MKKITILLLLLSLNGFLFGQKKGVSLTLEGETTLSFLTARFAPTEFPPLPNEDAGKKPISGFHIGATVHYPLNKKFGIVSGLSIDRKGGYGPIHLANLSHFDMIGFEQIPPIKNILDYWTIPLAFRVFWDKKSLFFVEAGGYWGHFVRQNRNSLPISGLKNNDIGVSFKTGLQLPLAKKWFLPLFFAAQHSVINNVSTTGRTREVTIQHNKIGFGMGLTYQLGQ